MGPHSLLPRQVDGCRADYDSGKVEVKCGRSSCYHDFAQWSYGRTPRSLRLGSRLYYVVKVSCKRILCFFVHKLCMSSV